MNTKFSCNVIVNKRITTTNGSREFIHEQSYPIRFSHLLTGKGYFQTNRPLRLYYTDGLYIGGFSFLLIKIRRHQKYVHGIPIFFFSLWVPFTVNDSTRRLPLHLQLLPINLTVLNPCNVQLLLPPYPSPRPISSLSHRTFRVLIRISSRLGPEPMDQNFLSFYYCYYGQSIKVSQKCT